MTEILNEPNEIETVKADVPEAEIPKSKKIKKVDVPEQSKERFHVVRFQSRQSNTDSQDVFLSVNGESFVIKRNCAVILPDRFKICADNAKIETHERDPETGVITDTSIIRYPYIYIREATESEYNEFRNTGKVSE